MAAAEFDPFDPAFIANPYPTYRMLREQDPVHRSPLGFWALTRYADCVAVLRDDRFGRRGFEPMLEQVFGSGSSESPQYVTSMLFSDPPDHTRMRSLVNKAFTPRVVERLRPRIGAIVDSLLDAAAGARTMDVIDALAYPLPVVVICEMLGVPADDRDRCHRWSLDVARALDAIGLPAEPEVIARGRASRAALTDYFRFGLIPERRKAPRADLLSALIAAEEQGDRLSEGELLATCNLLFVAGHETTVNLIGNGLLALLRHPEQLADFRAHPEIVESATEELLRYDGPVQRTGRIANTDVEIDGHKIARGDLVLTLLGAANRDPEHFADPERLDLRRADNRHLGFGWGIHFCLGAPLARVEAQIALEALVRRLPGLRLAGEPQWRPAAVLRGLTTLPVSW